MAAAAAVAPPALPSSHPAAPGMMGARSPHLKPETTIEQLKAAAMAATQKTTGINTPVSASFPQINAFPSSLHSPRPADTPVSASFRSTSSGSKSGTPMSPPSAYLDFLKILTPTFSPGSPHFTFQGGPNSARMAPPKSAALSHDSRDRDHRFSLPAQPLSARPALPSQSSSSSVSSNGSDKSNSVGANSTKSAPEASTSSTTTTKTKTWTLESIKSPTYPYPSGPTPRSESFPTIPPSPGHPDRPSRRPSLRIPESPTVSSPTLVRSPVTATIRSPKSLVQSPLSAMTPYSAGSKTSPVSIRHVVTRTIVYSSSPAATSHPHGIDSRLARTATQPLVGEAPKGKRRKLERDQE